MWKAYAKAGMTANPNDPDLAKYASGQALKTLKASLESYRSKDQVIKGVPVTSARIVSSPTNAPSGSITVSDCLDTGPVRAYKKSGALAAGKPGGHQATAAFVSHGADGIWKVTDLGVHEVGSC
jgi:hypothetical protein